MNTKRIAAAFAGATLVVLGGTSGAFAAYDPPTVDLTVTPTILPGGETFTGHASSNKVCDWSITYNGPTSTAQPITGHGSSIDFSYTTDTVEAQQTDQVTATCTYDDSLQRSSAIVNRSATADVTLTPADVSPPTNGGGNGGIGGLPNTGGPSKWLAALGAALTAIGAGAVIRSRRPARA